ncbi:MAG: c-type cytochrome [Parasphingorhabdus sp.]
MAILPALALTACSSDPVPEPVEQIVIREPGAPPVQPTPVTEPAASGENDEAALIAAGKSAFAICSGCHVVDADAPSTAGPNLYATVGTLAGAREDFAYSEALKSSGITWSEAELDAYIADPAGKIPGTTMVAGAVQDAEQRKAIIAYLKSLSTT